MKILLLAGASSLHTIRWANGLAREGLEVHLATKHSPVERLDAKVILWKFPNLATLSYWAMVPYLNRLLKHIRPNLINAHYASGYGTTASFLNNYPVLLSVWGSDVYDFPNKSTFHRALIRRNLLRATKIASTSMCMAERVMTLAPEVKHVAVTPFGVDTTKFSWIPSFSGVDQRIVIGTVKSLAPKYGITELLTAFAILRDRLFRENPNIASSLFLRIVGEGPQRSELEALTSRLGISETTTFVGRVDHERVPDELAKIDIYVALSTLDSESFGVAILEASAAGRPVVVSDVAGLVEVTKNRETGLVVPRGDPVTASFAIEELVKNRELRLKMGAAGRKHVRERYTWRSSLNRMIETYKSIL